MAFTDDEIKGAWLAGCSPAEFRKRGQVALSSSRDTETAGGFVMSRVGFDGHIVRMNGSDDSDGDSSTADDMAAEAMDHLQKFRDNPTAKNAHEHIARASAMCSAALSRCARDNADMSRISSGRGLLG
jgi:hypothetical protein